jgi:hypothetical protein
MFRRAVSQNKVNLNMSPWEPEISTIKFVTVNLTIIKFPPASYDIWSYTAVSLHCSLLLVMLCSIVPSYQWFRGTWCLLHQHRTQDGGRCLIRNPGIHPQDDIVLHLEVPNMNYSNVLCTLFAQISGLPNSRFVRQYLFCKAENLSLFL